MASGASTAVNLPDAQQERAPAPVRGLATLAGIQIELGQLDQAERTARRLLAIHDDYTPPLRTKTAESPPLDMPA